MNLPEERVHSLICPIGVSGITGKEPAVIAASVAAELLQVREGNAQKVSLPDAANDRSAP